MLTEPVCLISVGRLATLQTSVRRLRWALGMLACVGIALTVSATGRPRGLGLPEPIRPAEASSLDSARREPAWLLAAQDPLYDQFLQEYAPLRADAERRRYLMAQVLAAAAVHQLDPDLLFALVATESSFDSEAVSPKGARGLGQMLFATAQAVAPDAVRQPEDLHDVPRNLYATALHLRQLLDEVDGDLRWALRAYYAGAWDPQGYGRGGDRYVARVATHYAYLKAKRAYHHLSAVADAATISGVAGN